MTIEVPQEALVVAPPTFWEGVLRAWFQVMAQYSAAVAPREQDVPWWYNERASVGFLAAAIWRAGGVALEEFAIDKHEPAAIAGDPTTRFAGRCDLYAVLADAEVYVEAKQLPYDSCGRAFAASVEAGLDEAVAAVRYNRPARGARYGVVFAAPRMVASGDAVVDARLQEWFEAFQVVQCDAKAWYFPVNVQYTAIDAGLLYPGVAIFIQDANGLG